MSAVINYRIHRNISQEHETPNINLNRSEKTVEVIREQKIKVGISCSLSDGKNVLQPSLMGILRYDTIRYTDWMGYDTIGYEKRIYVEKILLRFQV